MSKNDLHRLEELEKNEMSLTQDEEDELWNLKCMAYQEDKLVFAGYNR